MKRCGCEYCSVSSNLEFDEYRSQYFCEDCINPAVSRGGYLLCKFHEVPQIEWSSFPHRESTCWAAYGMSGDGRRWRLYSRDGQAWFLEEI